MRLPTRTEKLEHSGRQPTEWRPVASLFCFAVVFLTFGLFALPCPAQMAAPWHEGFESAQPSWQPAGGDGDHRVTFHQRVRDQVHSGSAAERITLTGRTGTRTLFAQDVGNPPVIAELAASVWVKANRSGPQLMARVVFPRTPDPRSGKPVTTLIVGTSYTQLGRWQQLRLDNIPALLDRQVRILRMQIGPQVDPREAYIDRIILNAYGGPGTTDVWIDDLEIAGHVSRPVLGPPGGVPSADQGWVAATPGPPLANNPPFANNNGEPTRRLPATRSIELRGSILEVDQQPVFVRAIRYQGEPLTRLKELGFNTVWTTGPATDALLAEADREGLLLVCAPPQEVFAQPDAAAPLSAPPASISPKYAPVVAWDLGWGLAEEELPVLRQRASQVRSADPQKGRPRICHAEVNLRGFSRYTDLLVVGRAPLGTSLELTDHTTWIRERPRLARPGTVVWSTVQTEPSQALLDQWVFAGRPYSAPPEVTAEQIRLVAYGAIVAGSRGLLFDSRGSLVANDPATQNRAAALKLLNLELELIRPWVAAGNLIDTATVPNQPNVVGAVFRYKQSRLLVPMWVGPGAQFVPGQSAGNTVSFVAPVPESSKAHEVRPGGLRTIRQMDYIAGGMQVTLDEFSLSTLVLFTNDFLTLDRMKKRAEAIGPEAARLHRQLAAARLDAIREVDRRLAGRPASVWQIGNDVHTAQQYLQRCDGALAARDYRTACIQAERAMRPLRIVQRSNWEKAVHAIRSPISSPATVCFSTLPWHWNMVDQSRTWQLGQNLLAAGDFESLAAVQSAGWHHRQHATPGVEAHADVVPEALHSGSAGLRLRARPIDPNAPPTLVETSPLWVITPPIPVQTGTLVRIHGWVHLPTPIVGSVDGLVIFDSMTGLDMAERIGETTGWRSFTLYRVATQNGPLTVTFALSGLGEVWLDDLTIQSLGPAGPSLGAAGGWPGR
ncbi:MAG: hypothetical protein JW818_14620 [Pirellulales bacterium]|nr:hypothetical protein [Pirellulales bacterium]